MLVSKEVQVKWGNRNKNWYENKGYIFTKQNDEFVCKAEDIYPNSKMKVLVECDYCHKIYERQYDLHINSLDDCCKECKSIKISKSLKSKESTFRKSFYDWCKENNHEDWLLLWDYELNNCTPKEVGCGSKMEFYFKCPKGLHDSSAEKIKNLVVGSRPHGLCKKCHSFGQYLINEFGEDAIDKYWSKSNKFSPFDIKPFYEKKVKLICQQCGNEDDIFPKEFWANPYRCKACSDGYSYPNKFMYNLLKQLNVNFTSEYCPSWSSPRRYDFYLEDYKLIVEMDGSLGHGKSATRSYTLEETIRIDKEKDKLALDNGIYVIRIDCDQSKLDYIKNQIINSKFNFIFDLSNVNWLECEKIGKSSRLIEVCNIFNTKTKVLSEISDITGYDKGSIWKMIKKGTTMGLCNYNPKEAIRDNNIKQAKKLWRKCKILKDGICLGEFQSITELSNKSEELYGIKLSHGGISSVLCGCRKSLHGFTFEYID